MHGGVRNKLTKWWATDSTFAPLRIFCGGGHTHAKWNPKPVGKSLSFPTAEEAAYPLLLCKRVMAIVLQYAIEHGAIQTVSMPEQLPGASTTSHRWLLDMLPRGKKLKPLVSEFQMYKFFLNTVADDPEQAACFAAQPKGSRLVNRQIQWGKIRVDSEQTIWTSGNKEYVLENGAELEDKIEKELDVQAELCTMGIPREPWDFLRRAVEVGHPRSLAIHLNQEVIRMLEENFAGEVHLLVKTRAAFLMKWTTRCKELEGKEKLLHESLEPHLRGVLSGKRLLIFQEILDELGYPDRHLVKDICAGFPLTGWLPKSGIFPATVKRPTHNLETAKKLAKGINHSICKQVVATGDTDLDTEVWRQTEEEISKGWAWIDSECEVSQKLLAKRFGLQQSEKVRLIDDCTIGGFNGTCGSSEKLKVHSIDEMSAYIAWCLTNLSQQSMEDVQGKTYDLKNAYKQYGVHPADREALRLAVWNPVEQAVNFLGINALPFGAIGSVGAFLRISMAVWFIGVVGLRLCWTSFFDDFTMISKQLATNSAAIAAESLFGIMGIQFAREGKKAVAWNTQIKTLGEHGYVLLGHTEGRVAELSSLLD